jgi:hypothetical protein
MTKKASQKISTAAKSKGSSKDLTGFFADLNKLMAKHSITDQLHSVAFKPSLGDCVCNPPCVAPKSCTKVYSRGDTTKFTCQCEK